MTWFLYGSINFSGLFFIAAERNKTLVDIDKTWFLVKMSLNVYTYVSFAETAYKNDNVLVRLKVCFNVYMYLKRE